MNGGSSPTSAPPRLLAVDIPTSSSSIPRLSASAAREKISSLDSLPKSMIGLKRKFNPFGAVAASADQDGLHHMDKIWYHQHELLVGFYFSRSIRITAPLRLGNGNDVSQRRRFNEYKTLTLENDKLRNECLQYEGSEKQLVLKEQKLRSEIAEVEKKYQELLGELRSLDVKKEKQ
ncbi:Protein MICRORCHIDIA 6 [Zea mays]|uniref:Protein MICRORCHIDIA 6 n=1 Tax=Zea mays TaxID=4577 RepID=A0A1D6NMP1_MAIZE|nr:Protein MICRORCHIDIA 6 [Zea mays]